MIGPTSRRPLILDGYRMRVARPALPFSPCTVEEVADRYADTLFLEYLGRRRFLRPRRRDHVSLWRPALASLQGDLRKSLRVRGGEVA